MTMALKELTEVIPIESRVIIQINSDFKGEYKEYEDNVHRRIRDYFYGRIERMLEREDLAERIIRNLKNHGQIPDEVEEFQDLGTISISITENEA